MSIDRNAGRPGGLGPIETPADREPRLRYTFDEADAGNPSNGQPGRRFRFLGPGVVDRSGVMCATADDAAYVRTLLEMAYERGQQDALAKVRKAIGV